MYPGYLEETDTDAIQTLPQHISSIADEIPYDDIGEVMELSKSVLSYLCNVGGLGDESLYLNEIEKYLDADAEAFFEWLDIESDREAAVGKLTLFMEYLGEREE